MKALVPIANGSEEMEAVIIIDTLRRAEWDVTVAGLTEGVIEASRGVKLVPDTTWDQINPADFDIILLPGGFGGTEALMAHAGVQQTLRDFHAKGNGSVPSVPPPWRSTKPASSKAAGSPAIPASRKSYRPMSSP